MPLAQEQSLQRIFVAHVKAVSAGGTLQLCKQGNGRKLPPAPPLFALLLVPTFCTAWLCGADEQGLWHTRSSRDSLMSIVNGAVCSAPLLLMFVHTLQIGVVDSTATVAPLAVPPNDALRLPGLCKLD